MPFALPEGTNFYIVNTVIFVAFILYAIFQARAKRNYFLGVRSSESLSDPEIWKKANKKCSILTLAFTIPLLSINTIFAIRKLPESFPGALLVIFAIGYVFL